MNVTKKSMYVIGLVSTENSAGSNIFKTSLAKCLPISSIRSIGILQQWSLTWSQTLNRHASGKDKELHLPRENAHLSLCSP